jgi:hypothetical protein
MKNTTLCKNIFNSYEKRPLSERGLKITMFQSPTESRCPCCEILSPNGDDRADVHFYRMWQNNIRSQLMPIVVLSFASNPKSCHSAGQPRLPAPFSIFDNAYVAAQRFAEIDPVIDLPALELRWSSENKTVIGTKAWDKLEHQPISPRWMA